MLPNPERRRSPLGAPPGVADGTREGAVSRPGIRELIGRAMVDEGFRGALLRDPSAVLADFDLGAEERAAVMKAITQNRESPPGELSRALHAAVIKRWAT
jgi:hypothetical protein